MSVKEEDGEAEQGSGPSASGGGITDTSQGKEREGGGPVRLDNRKDGHQNSS